MTDKEEKKKKPIKQCFVENLNRILKENHLTQLEFSKRVNITAQAVYKYTKGIRAPGLGVVEKFAEGLGVSISELLMRESDLPTVPLSLTKDEVYQCFKEAIQNASSPFGKMKPVASTELLSVVERFGGWEYLHKFLVEEIELREKAENDYQKIRKEIYDRLSKEQPPKQTILKKKAASAK